jgi:hypothetical protein
VRYAKNFLLSTKPSNQDAIRVVVKEHIHRKILEKVDDQEEWRKVENEAPNALDELWCDVKPKPWYYPLYYLWYICTFMCLLFAKPIQVQLPLMVTL